MYYSEIADTVRSTIDYYDKRVSILKSSLEQFSGYHGIAEWNIPEDEEKKLKYNTITSFINDEFSKRDSEIETYIDTIKFIIDSKNSIKFKLKKSGIIIFPDYNLSLDISVKDDNEITNGIFNVKRENLVDAFIKVFLTFGHNNFSLYTINFRRLDEFNIRYISW